MRDGNILDGSKNTAFRRKLKFMVSARVTREHKFAIVSLDVLFHINHDNLGHSFIDWPGMITPVPHIFFSLQRKTFSLLWKTFLSKVWKIPWHKSLGKYLGENSETSTQKVGQNYFGNFGKSRSKSFGNTAQILFFLQMSDFENFGNLKNF